MRYLGSGGGWLSIPKRRVCYCSTAESWISAADVWSTVSPLRTQQHRIELADASVNCRNYCLFLRRFLQDISKSATSHRNLATALALGQQQNFAVIGHRGGGSSGALRCSRVLWHRSCCAGGMLQQTHPDRYFWGFKDSDMHRLARQRPWWENSLLFVLLVLFVGVSSLGYYFLNRLYNKLKPSGNDILVNQRIDELVFSRPDLAVAAVRMTIHHIISGVKTPFASPMVAPEYMRVEAETLLDFVLALHEEQFTYSIPDLWALVAAKALGRLGGPLINLYRGRPDPTDVQGAFLDSAQRDQLLVYTTSLVPESTRDVLNLKRILSRQGYALQEIVAVIMGIRTLGFHESSGLHTTEVLKPKLPRGGNEDAELEETTNAPETTLKCTRDPYVFGVEYADLLLDYRWTRSMFSRSGPFHCRENDRVREVVYLDPFSEQTLDNDRKKLIAREKAKAALGRAGSKRMAAVRMMTGGNNTIVESSESQDQQHDDGKSGSAEKEEGGNGSGSGTSSIMSTAWKSFFGRSGEAQIIPGIKLDKDGNLMEEEYDEELQAKLKELESSRNTYEIGGRNAASSPCPHISMREIDLMLLDDALCVGWLHRFSANEIQFYSVFGEAFSKTLRLGYNPNMLYLP